VNEIPIEPSREPTSRPSGLTVVFVLLRGIAGGIVGGVVGYLVVRWLKGQGMYGMMIPGALVGLGAGLAARGKSVLLGVICAAAALVLAIMTEWTLFHPRRELSFFLTHLHQLPTISLIMIGLGAVFAFWFGQGR